MAHAQAEIEMEWDEYRNWKKGKKSESKKIYIMKLCGWTKEALNTFSHTLTRMLSKR